MKRTLILTAGALALLLTACGGNGEKTQPAADSVTVRQPSGPVPAENPLTRATTVNLGGHTFHVEIRRFVDKEQPTVKDDLDQEFYDNGVEVTVMSEGSKFFHHTFRKDDFSGFVSAAERRGYVFLGMAYDDRKSGGRTLCLAAQQEKTPQASPECKQEPSEKETGSNPGCQAAQQKKTSYQIQGL